jgi:hypothetical protein
VTTYSSTGLNASTTYYYRVRAYNSSGNSSYSNTAGGTTFAGGTSSAYSGAWVWGGGGSSHDTGSAVAVNSKGNIVVAGVFWSPSLSLGGGTLVNAGGYDMFIAEISGSGTHLWSKRFGGTGSEIVSSIGLDAQDNIFVGGQFSGTTDLGGGSMTSQGGMDIFLAKYSPTGDFRWAKHFGTSEHDYLNDLAVEASTGNVVITGSFPGSNNNPLDFGGDLLMYGSTYLAKFSGANGSHIWSKNFGSPYPTSGTSVAIAPNGDIVVGGGFHGAIDLTREVLTWPFPGTALIAIRDGESSRDLFVGRFSSAGAHLWSKSFGGPSDGYGVKRVALDGAGNVFILGSFEESIDFGGGILRAEKSVDQAGSSDIFLVKLTTGGNHLWSKSFPGSTVEWPSGMAVDSKGNVAVAGDFRRWIDISGTVLSSAKHGTSDIFVAKYSGSGSLHWAERFGGAETELSTALAVTGEGSVVVTGNFWGTASFGGEALTSKGAGDIFVLKLEP